MLGPPSSSQCGRRTPHTCTTAAPLPAWALMPCGAGSVSPPRAGTADPVMSCPRHQASQCVYSFSGNGTPAFSLWLGWLQVSLLSVLPAQQKPQADSGDQRQWAGAGPAPRGTAFLGRGCRPGQLRAPHCWPLSAGERSMEGAPRRSPGQQRHLHMGPQTFPGGHGPQ